MMLTGHSSFLAVLTLPEHLLTTLTAHSCGLLKHGDLAEPHSRNPFKIHRSVDLRQSVWSASQWNLSKVVTVVRLLGEVTHPPERSEG